MLPSHSELTYFIEICNTLNLSRASERLGISQPTLSLSLRKLETTIGSNLFIRHKQGVHLTQAGKQLLIHVRQLLQYWQETQSKALASEEEIQGTYTLGCHSTIAIHIVSRFLPELLATYPKLNINLTTDISRKITEQVINLSVDFGIVANPIKHPDLIIHKLCNDQVTFWMGKGTNTTILCDPALTQTQALLKKARTAGISTDRIMSIPSLEVVASLSAAGCGIGILPTRVVQALHPQSLNAIANAPVYSDEICLIYRHELRQVKAAQEIVRTIKACI